MSVSAFPKSKQVEGQAERPFSLKILIRLLFRKRSTLRHARTADLPPALLRDIGLEELSRRLPSLEDKWRRELELQAGARK